MRFRYLPVVALACGCALQLTGCGGGSDEAAGSGASSGNGGTKSSGASGSGGSAVSSGGSGSGGVASGGAGGVGGTAPGGVSGSSAAGSGGSAVGGGGATTGGSSPGGGSGGAGGTGGSSSSGGWACPAASTFSGSPLPSAAATAERITGAPPADTFNNTGNDFTNVEGPVWIGDALYFSEYLTDNVNPASRILKIAASGDVTEFITDSGSNGLATDGAGNILSANHKAQGIVRFSLPDKTPTTLVSMANSKPLNSPNDLTVASDGTIYFTDPDHQNTSNPQGATRVYQLVQGGSQATIVTDYASQPNGIALSLDNQTLIVGGMSGVKKYPITNGSVAMTGTSFGPAEVTNAGVNTDGMTLDCAGNLYVAVAGGSKVFVVKPDGTTLGTVAISGGNVTNVAFGGADHQTLFVTAQGSGKGQGVFKLHLSIPGLPY